MSNEELFVKATREKMRFPYKGQATVEDLWDLSMTELDRIYKTLNAQQKRAQEDSLLDTKSEEDEELTAQIEIVRYIFAVKYAMKKSHPDNGGNAEDFVRFKKCYEELTRKGG